MLYNSPVVSGGEGFPSVLLRDDGNAYRDVSSRASGTWLPQVGGCFTWRAVHADLAGGKLIS